MKINVAEYLDFLESEQVAKSEPIVKGLEKVMSMYGVAGSKNVYINVPKGIGIADYIVDKYCNEETEVLVK